MAKIAIKSEKLTPFGGFFSIMEQFDSMLSPILSTRHLVRDAAVLPPPSPYFGIRRRNLALPNIQGGRLTVNVSSSSYRFSPIGLRYIVVFFIGHAYLYCKGNTFFLDFTNSLLIGGILMNRASLINNKKGAYRVIPYSETISIQSNRRTGCVSDGLRCPGCCAPRYCQGAEAALYCAAYYYGDCR